LRAGSGNAGSALEADGRRNRQRKKYRGRKGAQQGHAKQDADDHSGSDGLREWIAAELF
jgi:hypothetical protein